MFPLKTQDKVQIIRESWKQMYYKRYWLAFRSKPSVDQQCFKHSSTSPQVSNYLHGEAQILSVKASTPKKRTLSCTHSSKHQQRGVHDISRIMDTDLCLMMLIFQGHSVCALTLYLDWPINIIKTHMAHIPPTTHNHPFTPF